MKQWTRRALLLGGIAVTLPVTGLSAAKFWCHINYLPASKRHLALLQNFYPPSPATRALGKQYLEQTSSDATTSLQRLGTLVPLMRAAESGCRVATMSAVEQACRDDFRCGGVHCIDGWVLAQTELDLAAICTIG